jgi:hypothetical protein
VHKLEWIVKLDPEPLRLLVEDLDCRAGRRSWPNAGHHRLCVRSTTHQAA